MAYDLIQYYIAKYTEYIQMVILPSIVNSKLHLEI